MKLKLDFKQVSTWTGLFALMGLGGVYISPDHQQAIMQGAIALIGVVNTFGSDK